MKLKKFDPNEIMVPEVRVTSRFDAETWDLFRESIGADPSAVFIICIMVDGRPVLVDGMHRLEEALRLKLSTINVALIEGDMVDVLTNNLKLDHLRGKHPATEMLTVIQALTEEYGLDSEKIAGKTGLRRDYIEKIQAVAQLTPAIRAALDDDRIKISHAYELTRLKDPVQQETVFNQQQMYHWTVKELSTYITDLLNIELPPPPEPGQAPPRPTVKCAFCGEEHDPLDGKIANPNTCQTCAGILFAATAQARAEAEAEARRRQTDAGHDSGEKSGQNTSR